MEPPPAVASSSAAPMPPPAKPTPAPSKDTQGGMAAPYAPNAAAARAAAAAPPPRAEKASAPHEYQPPVWSAVPVITSTPFSFEVIKDGVVVSNMDLSERPYYVIGRHKSTAHLVLEHPSISRQHVIVQHGGLEEGVAIKGDVEEEPAAGRPHELAPVRAHAQRLPTAAVSAEVRVRPPY